MNIQHYYQTLNTDTFYLRKLTHNDIPSWIDFFENNENLKYLNFDFSKSIKEITKEWINIEIERYKKNEFGQLGIVTKSADELIGIIGFSIGNNKELIKGTSIKPSFWKQGIGTQASILINNANFKYNWFSRIVGFRDIKNEHSRKLAARLGFKDMEIMQSPFQTTVKYQLTRKMWENNSLYSNFSHN